MKKIIINREELKEMKAKLEKMLYEAYDVMESEVGVEVSVNETEALDHLETAIREIRRALILTN
jgi:RNA polymerase-interacting CarD/CdnL/TRCF family regulator